MIAKSVLFVGILFAFAACSKSPERPEQLDDMDMAKIAAKMTGLPFAEPEIQLYNGTEWRITNVDIILTNKRTNEDRRFRFSGSVSPLSDGSLQGSIGDFLLDGLKKEGEIGYSPSLSADGSGWAWSMVGVRGIKK